MRIGRGDENSGTGCPGGGGGRSVCVGGESGGVWGGARVVVVGGVRVVVWGRGFCDG